MNTNLGRVARPWIHALVVFPEGADLGGLHTIQTNPRLILPRGQARVIVFHPTALSTYIGMMARELEPEPASALVLALGGRTEGTWMERHAARDMREPQRTRRLRFKIVWEDGS